MKKASTTRKLPKGMSILHTRIPTTTKKKIEQLARKAGTGYGPMITHLCNQAMKQGVRIDL
jgi:hypothetical protein